MDSILGTLILFLTGLVTYKGFMDRAYLERNIFHIDPILIGKEYKRLFSSGFLHANWLHFGFNMGALLSFSFSLELIFGVGNFALIYFASLLGGSLLALYIHRNHGDYRALGASGAISGVVMSSIILFPEGKIGFFFLPFEMPNWVFALLFIGISVFGIKSQRDNIGHEAHLGGAITGILMTLVLKPEVFISNLWIVCLTLIPISLFLLLIIRKPEILLIDNYWGIDMAKKKSKPTKREIQQKNEITLNQILDKIKASGVDSLTEEERRLLDKMKDQL